MGQLIMSQGEGEMERGVGRGVARGVAREMGEGGMRNEESGRMVEEEGRSTYVHKEGQGIEG